MQNTLRQEISKLRKEKRNVALPKLVLVYFALIGIFYAAYALPAFHWFWIVPALGVAQYYVVISGHEAVHETLCFPRRLNEFFGVLGQSMVGVNFTAYRQQHIDHHRCQEHTEDPDAHIYYGVISVQQGWKRFFWLTFGTFIEIIVKIHQKGSGGYGSERQLKQGIVNAMKRDSRLVIIAQILLMTFCNVAVGGFCWELLVQLGVSFSGTIEQWSQESSLAYFWSRLVGAEAITITDFLRLVVDGCWSYFVLWAGPLFCVTVFLNRCRIVVEHGLALQMLSELQESSQERSKGPRIPTVDIVPSALERFVFAPFLFNYHCSHHLFMAVPHYNLPKLHKLLIEHQHQGHYTLPGGYVRALRTMLRNA